jgi:hypothetical protein
MAGVLRCKVMGGSIVKEDGKRKVVCPFSGKISDGSGAAFSLYSYEE